MADGAACDACVMCDNYKSREQHTVRKRRIALSLIQTPNRRWLLQGYLQTLTTAWTMLTAQEQAMSVALCWALATPLRARDCLNGSFTLPKH